VCDDLVTRLDYLLNISPDAPKYDDDEFPRINGNSIGNGYFPYQEPGNQWIKMHDIKPEFHIFGTDIRPLDIGQGGLGDCYFLAAMASLANIRGGEPIKQVF
jgi:hypothetical protein